jgi:hypothetical protein
MIGYDQHSLGGYLEIEEDRNRGKRWQQQWV